MASCIVHKHKYTEDCTPATCGRLVKAQWIPATEKECQELTAERKNNGNVISRVARADDKVVR